MPWQPSEPQHCSGKICRANNTHIFIKIEKIEFCASAVITAGILQLTFNYLDYVFINYLIVCSIAFLQLPFRTN